MSIVAEYTYEVSFVQIETSLSVMIKCHLHTRHTGSYILVKIKLCCCQRCIKTCSNCQLCNLFVAVSDFFLTLCFNHVPIQGRYEKIINREVRRWTRSNHQPADGFSSVLREPTRIKASFPRFRQDHDGGVPGIQ